MDPLKWRVTVGLFGVVLAAAACGGGSTSTTSTGAKPSRGFVATVSHVTLTCPVGADSSGTVQLKSKIFGTPASPETPISCTSGQTSKVDIQPTSEPSVGYSYGIELRRSESCPNNVGCSTTIDKCGGSGTRPTTETCTVGDTRWTLTIS
jgi:hypothetical protein